MPTLCGETKKQSVAGEDALWKESAGEEHCSKEEDKWSEPHLQLENARGRGGVNITADHLCICASSCKENSRLGKKCIKIEGSFVNQVS